MRVLLVLRGAPGSGKTSFIKENNLEEFVLSMDNIRVAINGYSRDFNNRLYISQDDNNYVTKVFNKSLVRRMEREEFIVIDGTNANSKTISSLKKFSKDYRYRLYIKDMTDYSLDKELYLKELLRRNSLREEERRVSKDVIENFLDKIYETRPLVEKYLIEDLSEIYYRKIDLNKYERIRVFGDIHGNIEALKRGIEDLADKDFLILTGDYVDRGLNNKEVVELLYDLSERDNVVLLRGNHEKWIKYQGNGRDNIGSRIYREITFHQLEKIENHASVLRRFYRKLHQCFYFTYGESDFFVSHAAVPYWDPRVIVYPYETLTSQRVSPDLAAESWSKDEEAPYLIHGHINFDNGEFIKEKAINLNSDLEFGGRIPYLTLSKDGEGRLFGRIDIVEADELISEDDKNKQLLSLLFARRDINVKELKDGIYSYNFREEVFHNRSWNELNILARGLFANKDMEVLARGYDKFFNYGELYDREETNLNYDSYEEMIKLEEEEWVNIHKDAFEYPVKFYQKENGFLGIISLVGDDLLYCSKSLAILGDRDADIVEDKEGLYGEYHVEILRSMVAENKDKFKEVLKKLNSEGDSTYSLVFEVCNSELDPHLVYYQKPELFLLDVVENRIDKFSKKPYDETFRISQELGISCKKLVAELDSFDEILKFVNRVRDSVKGIEGFVVEDQKGFMFKLKLNEYLESKQLRGMYSKLINSVHSSKKKFTPRPLDESLENVSFKDYALSLDLNEKSPEDFLEILMSYREKYN